jgi:hypothetical protein
VVLSLVWMHSSSSFFLSHSHYLMSLSLGETDSSKLLAWDWPASVETPALHVGGSLLGAGGEGEDGFDAPLFADPLESEPLRMVADEVCVCASFH